MTRASKDIVIYNICPPAPFIFLDAPVIFRCGGVRREGAEDVAGKEERF